MSAVTEHFTSVRASDLPAARHVGGPQEDGGILQRGHAESGAVPGEGGSRRGHRVSPWAKYATVALNKITGKGRQHQTSTRLGVHCELVYCASFG